MLRSEGERPRAIVSASVLLTSTPLAFSTPHDETPAVPRRRGRLLAAVAAGAVAVAAIVGYVVGKPSDEGAATGPGPSNVAVETPSVALQRPSAWRVSDSPPPLPGLALADSVGFGPGDASDAGIIAGSSQAPVGASLLPAAFVSRVSGKLPRGESVKIGDATGLRYRDLQVDGFGNRRLSLYVVPTTAGVATAACYSSPTAALSRDACERVIGTLQLKRGDAVPLGADPGYAEALNADLADLAKARRNLRAQLGAAKTFRGQAAIATKLANAHRRAANAVAAGHATPAAADAQDQLAAALRATAGAYTALAKATRGHNQKAYDRARSDIARDDGDLRRAIKGFSTLGYRVR